MTLDQALTRLGRQLARLPGELSRNIALQNENVLKSIIPKVADWSSPLNRLSDALGKADKLQTRAISMGTTITRFQRENSEALSKLYGGVSETTQALMDLRSVGLRQTGNELNKLMVFMRYSGQNTAGLVEQMSRMSVYTGNNTRSMDKLAKENSDISKTYKVTNESLINALNSLDSTIKIQAGLVGSTNITGVIQNLQGIFGERATPEIKMAIQKLFDPREMAFRTMTGTAGIQSQIAGMGSKEATITVLEAFKKIAQFGERQTKGLGSSEAGIFAKEGILSNMFGSSEQFLSFKFLADLNGKEIMSILENSDKASDEDLRNQRMIVDNASKFYDVAVNDYYAPMLSNLDTIAKWTLAQGITGSIGGLMTGRFFRTMARGAGGAGGALLGGASLGRFILGAGRLLSGPVGLGLTIGLPLLYKYFTSDDRNKDSENADITAKNIKEINDRQKSPDSQPLTLNAFIAEQIRKSYEKNQSNVDQKNMSELNITMQKLSNVISNFGVKLKNGAVSRDD